MTFIIQEYQARSSYDGYTGDKVRVSFKKKDKHTECLVYFGKDVLKKVGITKDDRIEFYIDDAEPRMWFFKKGQIGLKLIDNNKNNKVFRLQKNIKNLDINVLDNKGFCTFDVWDGGILVFLPKCPLEARQFIKTVL